MYVLFPWLLPFLPVGKIIGMGLDIAYSILIKLLGLIFYLASEYWGRWVLVGICILISLLYARHHYIAQGRTQEAKFCDLRIDDALRQKQRPKNSLPKADFSIEDWLRF